MSTLDPLFSPRTIAIVGASFEPSGRAYGHVRALIDSGYGGEIIPVHPTEAEIYGRRAVAQLKDVKREIDVVVCAVPPTDAVSVVREAAAVRARALLLPGGCGGPLSSSAGAKARKEALSLARGAKMRLLGPHAGGIADPQMGVGLTTLVDLPRERGGISLVAPGTAYFLLLAAELRARGRGFARALAYGEQLDVDVADALEYLGKDARTEAILLVLDELRDGQKFLSVASEVALQKPVIALHLGGRAAEGPDLHATTFRQCGLVAAHDLEELLDLGVALSTSQRNLPATETVGVAVLPEGLATLARAACARARLAVAEWDSKSTRALKRLVGEVRSPISVPSPLVQARSTSFFETLLADSRAGGLLLFSAGGDSVDLAEGIVEARRKSGKPVVAMAVGAPNVAAALLDGGVPTYPTPERAARAYTGLFRYRSLLEVQKRKGILARPKPPAAVAPADVSTRERDMREPEILGLLKATGLVVPEGVVLETLKSANSALRKIGFPMTLRALPTRKVPPKRNGELSIEGLKTRRELDRGFLQLRKRFHRCPVFIEPAAPNGRIVPLVVRRDPTFGPVLTVEGPSACVSRVCPLGKAESEILLAEAGVVPGGKAHGALVDLVVRFAHLACEKEGIRELTLHPRLGDKGSLWIGDAHGLIHEAR